MRPKRVSMQSSKRPTQIPESKSPKKQQKEKNDEEELEYSVERIVRRRYDHNGKAEYQIKWTGYQNLTWEPVENLGPANLGDAPVFLSIGPNDHWIFGLYRGMKRKSDKNSASKKPAFVAEDQGLYRLSEYN